MPKPYVNFIVGKTGIDYFYEMRKLREFLKNNEEIDELEILALGVWIKFLEFTYLYETGKTKEKPESWMGVKLLTTVRPMLYKYKWKNHLYLL